MGSCAFSSRKGRWRRSNGGSAAAVPSRSRRNAPSPSPSPSRPADHRECNKTCFAERLRCCSRSGGRGRSGSRGRSSEGRGGSGRSGGSIAARSTGKQEATR